MTYSVLFMILFLISSLMVETTLAQTSTILSDGSTYKTQTSIASYGTIQSTNIQPVNAHSNGIWAMAGEITPSSCALYASMNINAVYIETGTWQSNGQIVFSNYDGISLSVDIIRQAINNAHAAGLKIYAWVISINCMYGYLDISTYESRRTAINSMVNLVQTYGFDGMADDVEEVLPWNPSALVAYYNEATNAMHAIGKEYFAAMIVYWSEAMSTQLFSSIKVDLLQPMMYIESDYMTEAKFKDRVDYFLRYSQSSVSIAIEVNNWYDSNSFFRSISYTDSQIASGTPTGKLKGIDIFWSYHMTQSQWDAWRSWSLKN